MQTHRDRFNSWCTGLRYGGARCAAVGTLPPGLTAGHAQRASRASTRFTSVEQASEEGVEEGVKWALSQLAGLILSLSTEFEPRAEKNVFVDKVVSEYP